MHHRPPYEEDHFGRVPRYREFPPHGRAPRFEDDEKRKNRPTREVIVQKADHWSDPWMRSKSPGVRESRNAKRDHRSYSSNSSYSSSRYVLIIILLHIPEVDMRNLH